MNKGLNAVKNIFWMLTLIVAVIAVLVGTVFAVSRKFYGDRLDGALDIRSEKVSQVKKPSASQAPAGGDGLIELNGTQDAGIEYVLSLTYLCDSTIIGLNDYASGLGNAKANMWTDSGTGLTAAAAGDTMIVSPSDSSQLTPVNAAMVYQPKRLVIYIGGDGLASATEESFTAGYKKLIESVLASSPNTSVVCCSIGSIAAAYTGSDGLTVEQFAEANKWIESVCRETGVKFADLASILNGENGYLKVEYAAPDGRSLNSAGINELINYFRYHASF